MHNKVDFTDGFVYAYSGYVPEGSIHANSNYIPQRRYAKTDNEVITNQTWAQVGFVFNYDAYGDFYAFEFSVDGVLVDTAFYAVLSNTIGNASVYPTSCYIGA